MSHIIRARLGRVAAVVMAGTLLASCGGAPDQYFRLTEAGPAPLRAGGMAVAVGPVTLPTYLDRPELVYQSGPNEFQIPAKAHWAGSLSENIAHVVAVDLGRLLGSGRVVAAPWPPGAAPRYQVTIGIAQFQAISGQGVVLDASWRIENGGDQQVLRWREGSFHAPIEGDGYAPVVAAESNLLEQLAEAIHQSL